MGPDEFQLDPSCSRQSRTGRLREAARQALRRAASRRRNRTAVVSTIFSIPVTVRFMAAEREGVARHRSSAATLACSAARSLRGKPAPRAYRSPAPPSKRSMSCAASAEQLRLSGKGTGRCHCRRSPCRCPVHRSGHRRRCRRSSVSLPALPASTSDPLSPERVSLPAPPDMRSESCPPLATSLPSPASRMSLPAPSCT